MHKSRCLRAAQTRFYQSGCRRRGRQFFRSTSSSFADDDSSLFSLDPPEILWSSCHLLVVNKPPGWHTVPDRVSKGGGFCRTKRLRDDAKSKDKCIYTHLAARKLGGGSTKQFLYPIHRIDPPCSGVLMIGKSNKAHARLGSSIFGLIKKTYLAIVEAENRQGEALLERHVDGEWTKLRAHVKQTKRRILLDPDDDDDDEEQKEKGNERHDGRTTDENANNDDDDEDKDGWPVTMFPLSENDAKWNNQTQKKQYVEMESFAMVKDGPNRNLLLLRTRKGRRHMIRGLLACHGLVVRGDVAYGAPHALPDHSIALHAHALDLPATLKLGKDLQFLFEAPVPKRWSEYFGFSQDDIRDQFIEIGELD